jgi:hypothetical protein
MPETEMQVDIVALIEEMAAIYFHVELDNNPPPETLARWRQDIETDALLVCGEVFNLDPDILELEVVLLEGSLWVKLKPKLATIGLILSLYNGVHNLPQNVMSDYERFAQGAKTVVEKVIGGHVDRIQGPWNNSDVLHEFVQRTDPTRPPED